MNSFPISYNEPLFRPPSEGRSVIIQVSYGCSWNQCAFCEMYSDKKFTARPLSDIFKDIDAFIPYKDSIRRVFLADGDPMALSTNTLIQVLDYLKNKFPKLSRVSAYASPRNINKKSILELEELKFSGLTLLYIGIESGDNQVLKLINKGETFATTVAAFSKLRNANLNSSVMIINGLGGRELSKQHALNSAKILNEIQVKYVSLLVLNTYKGLDYFKSKLNTEFSMLSPIEMLLEMREFLDQLELKETIFRSDHASNYLVLKGVLGRDKQRFIKQIDHILDSGDLSKLRAEYQRGF